MRIFEKKKFSITTRLYISVASMLLFTVIVTGVICARLTLSLENEDRDTLIRDLAAMVAGKAVVAEELLSPGSASERLTAELDNLSNSLSQIDLIVVCDTESRRIYHTRHERIHDDFIGNDQYDILAGSEPYISIAVGSMGLQRRAFHAVRDAEGEILGFVMVSVLDTHITKMQNSIIRSFLTILLVMLIVGFIVAAVYRFHLENVLLGYRPEEFANMYIERAEVLDALEEGIFAIDANEDIILMNHSAKNMLNLPADLSTEGHKLTEYYPETRLPETVRSGRKETNVNFTIKGKNIISSRIPIRSKGRIIGAVSIFRNRTEVFRLAEELTGAQYMVDTLRSANHEFMNRLHVILGFLEMNEPDKAKHYILNTSLVSSEAISDIHHRVPISSLAALLIGKMLKAHELGIKFVLKSDSYFREKENQLPADCFVTLVGNLVENAMDELNSGDYPVKRIEMGIYSEEGNTTIVCDDTGGGIPEEILISIYDPHTTTKGPGHGSGFRLMKDIVDRYEGTFHIDTEKGEGTSIEINLPI